MRPSRLLRILLLASAYCFTFKFAAQQPGGTPISSPPTPEPGLLFYLSGDHGFQADFAASGLADPNFLKDVKILPNGSKGSYLQCGDTQLLSYWAPGNIYAQRGTLAFDWRARSSVDDTAFPIFRVGYGDHSSWDMVWLRIDYNGHGFDAFVTDVNLGRTRVSYTLLAPLDPMSWQHIAITWDETTGISLYLNGRLIGSAAATGMFDAALDQFGPHSRVIAPDGVESSYNYDRGGDLDELRIYDRALSDTNITQLSKHETPTEIPSLSRDLAHRNWQSEWLFDNGWNRPDDIPAPLPTAETTVRKVQINDAYDLKRWWYKGIDGIRETTWPGVYNRSRLPNRYDYFQLPDWDCYALSGKSIVFHMPDEKWNHLEIEGGAWGRAALLTPSNDPGSAVNPDQYDTEPLLAKTLFDRPRGQQHTSHDFAIPLTGQLVRFTNEQIEWPIQELSAYYVHPGKAPEGFATLRYTLTASGAVDNPALISLEHFIKGRYPSDERATIVASPGSTPARVRNTPTTSSDCHPKPNEGLVPAETCTLQLPLVHILIPSDFRDLQADEGHGTGYSWRNLHAGLDGISLDIPALNLKPTNGPYIPMSIRVKDPLWPMRDMLDFSFSVKPGEAHTLWLDLRDRILPPDASLYLTIASASPEFSPASLEGAQLRLVFKPYAEALTEHVADRLNQVRDNFANMTEESVNSRKLNLYNRFEADITDLLRVDPTNKLGLAYWHEKSPEQPASVYAPPPAPAGVPSWAWLQTRDLEEYSRLINWWVDNRQISDGEMGGGLSDDSDFFEWWPGLALMGANPDKLRVSLNRGLEAIYNNGMFTNGLATAQYDELHAYEDGINMVGEAMMIDYGNPKEIERAMLTAKREAEWLTGYNSAGQRQIKSSYYSGTKMAEGGVWGWGKAQSYFVYHPALLLVDYNGNPEAKRMITETADGFLAHRRPDANGKMQMHFTVNFHTNEDKVTPGLAPWFVLWGAYRFTGDKKYLAPFNDDPATALRVINADTLDVLNVRNTWGNSVLAASRKGNDASRRTDNGTPSETNNHFAWQLTGDTAYLDKVYTAQLHTASDRQFINREGSLWIDRIYFNNGELQRARLGGVALMRNQDFPGNVISWSFEPTADNPTPETSVGILVPIATDDHIKVVAYNLSDTPIKAKMIGAEISPGKWEMKYTNSGDDVASSSAPKTVEFERSSALPITFPPHAYTEVELNLKEKGTPYWERPDLGISSDDVSLEGHTMKVTIHSLGAVDAPDSKLTLRDAAGRILTTAPIPALKAPLDLIPKIAVVTLHVADIASVATDTLTIDSPALEITLVNNQITVGSTNRTRSAAQELLHSRR
ncbi:LamG domain-containing protein [Granulicella paludicola]|uniref:LamG domain-containing protein n=1 Tax=Granulicella paludicola TaxID=474951 RepID=UPI0021DF9B24|nr:LamG domain-containing protein [Granulicella paludicola]